MKDAGRATVLHQRTNMVPQVTAGSGNRSVTVLATVLSLAIVTGVKLSMQLKLPSRCVAVCSAGYGVWHSRSCQGVAVQDAAERQQVGSMQSAAQALVKH